MINTIHSSVQDGKSVHRLIGRNITCGYNGKAVLTDVNVSVQSGEVLCILGPNGVGKTTLFLTLLGLLPIIKGSVEIDDINREQLSRRELASKVAYVPQSVRQHSAQK